MDKEQSTYREDARDDMSSHSEDLRHGLELLEAEREMSTGEVFRTFPRVMLLSLAAGVGGLLFGYDQVANGASLALPSFLLYFGAMTPTHQLYIPTIWASLWTAMAQLLQALGGLIAGYIADRFGRRYTVMGFSIISAAGTAVQFSANSRGQLLGGKMINGLAIGAILALCTMWASEIAPLRLRGPVQSGIVLCQVLMQALALIVVRQRVTIIEPIGFRVVFALMWIWCGITFIAFFFVPESPTWLILKKRIDQARASVRTIYGPNNHPDARFAVIKHEVELEMQFEAERPGSFLDLYRGINLKRTLTIHLLFFGIGLAGASFLAQSIYFLIIAGLPAIHTFDVSCGGFALAVFTIVGSWFFIDKIGRRPLWLWGVVGNVIVMTIIGGLAYAPGKGPVWAIAILMNVLICYQSTTLTTGCFIIAAELSSYRLRAKSQAVAIMSNAITTWLFNFVVPYMYNIDSGNLGAKTGFVFAGGSLLLLVVSYFVVPELKSFTTDEIDWLYSQKISVRKFPEYADGRAKDGAEQLNLEKTRSLAA